jgi:MGT family glycosyltransferase
MVPHPLAMVGRVARIGVVHVGWQGHVAPANRLTAALAASGHSVVAWAPPDFHGQIADAGAEFRSLPWRVPSDNDGVAADPSPAFHRPAPQPDQPVALAVMHGIHELALSLAGYTLMVGEVLTAAAHEENLDLVVHDVMAPWGRVAAEWLGLPRLASYPGFPPPFEIDAPEITPELEQHLAVARQTVAQRWGIEFADSRDVLVSEGDATAAFTTPEIAGQDAPDPSWRLVGPLMGSPPASATDVPDDDRPLVYMALGTVHNWRTDVFRATIDALADEDVRLLVSTGGRLDPRTFEPLPPNVTVVPYVDSRAVLSGAALHVTHGGANSVHESLAAGVPMVCLPQGDDHHLWADRVRVLGAGSVVSTAEPETIRAAVLDVLADTAARRRAGEVAQHLRDFPGESVVAATVAELLD